MSSLNESQQVADPYWFPNWSLDEQKNHHYGVGVLDASRLRAAVAQSSNFTIQNLGSGVWAAIAIDAGKAGGNAGFVAGDDGLLVIDTFESPEAARGAPGGNPEGQQPDDAFRGQYALPP